MCELSLSRGSMYPDTQASRDHEACCLHMQSKAGTSVSGFVMALEVFSLCVCAARGALVNIIIFLFF